MKRLLPILAVIPLALAACTDAEDAAAPISSEVATTTSSTAPEGPVEVDLGEPIHLVVMSRDVVESVEGYAANRRVVSVVVVEVEPAGQRQASFGL